MSDRFVPVIFTKPSDEELMQAILCFREDTEAENEKRSGEEMLNAGIVIVGEACSLISDGEAIEDILQSLESRGLSMDCAAPFVEKALEIVESNREINESKVENKAQNFIILLIFATIVIAILSHIFLSY